MAVGMTTAIIGVVYSGEVVVLVMREWQLL